MRRSTLLWLGVVAAIAVLVAGQVVTAARSASTHGPGAPTVRLGLDVLAGVEVVAERLRGDDYRRAAFGHSWDDDTSAPGGRNGCDTRNDVLDRDLREKSYVPLKRCPRAVASGTLRDPYTDKPYIVFYSTRRVGGGVLNYEAVKFLKFAAS